MVRIFENVDICSRNSFGVHQQAAKIIEFDNSAELGDIFRQHISGEWLVMGGGNNIIFTQDITPTILFPRNCDIEVINDGIQSVTIRVGAGLEWDELVEWAVEHNLWGLENLSLIPGKVGAAPVQNIGAYGAEAKDCITNVEMYSPQTDNFITLAAEHCGFGYRESVFKHSLKGRVIITAVEFRLSKNPNPKLNYGDLCQEVENRGGATLTGNAGSFFKNPIVERAVAEALLAENPNMPHYPTTDPEMVKLAAGWLIDQCGLKGYSEGNVGVHSRQALVLINTTGEATGAEVIAFARKVQQKVLEKFGIEIDTEVNIL